MVLIVSLGSLGLFDRLRDGLFDLVHAFLYRAVIVPTTLFTSAVGQKNCFTLRASGRGDGLERVV
ncbi:MAG: hypothetical protein NUV56_04045 [Candidatus Uhrbacteria bacterium]|nr:hypothetical protein [Candidatus Uhrbacteria bacterium]